MLNIIGNKTIGKQIADAQRIADNAIAVFKTALSDLVTSNDTLERIVDDEIRKIDEHRTNISIAKTKISLNNDSIRKLKEFLPKE